MKLTFRLMQTNGVSGPSKTVEVENPDPHPVAINRMARAWAEGQTGHPWDVLAVEDESGNSREVTQK